MNYDELVAALRHCATRSNGCVTCAGCPMSSENGDVIECINALHKDAADEIEALQAQMPKRGEWKRVEDGETYHYECSECGERPLYSRFGDIVLSGVCPMCGAKMEVQE